MVKTRIKDVARDEVQERRAIARMAEIDALLQDGHNPELEAERKALDGSWLTERWLELDIITEAEAVENDRKEAAEKEAKRAAHAAKKAKLADWAKKPPQGLPALQAAFAELAQIVNDQVGELQP